MYFLVLRPGNDNYLKLRDFFFELVIFPQNNVIPNFYASEQTKRKTISSKFLFFLLKIIEETKSLKLRIAKQSWINFN